jgi:hypothetical protein
MKNLMSLVLACGFILLGVNVQAKTSLSLPTTLTIAKDTAAFMATKNTKVNERTLIEF